MTKMEVVHKEEINDDESCGCDKPALARKIQAQIQRNTFWKMKYIEVYCMQCQSCKWEGPDMEEEIKFQGGPNFFVRHKILIMVTLLLSAVGYLLWFHGVPFHWALSPLYANFFFMFGGIVLNKRQEYMEREAWRMYVDKYGNKRGNIPAHVRMLHKKMNERGIKIQI